MIRFTFVYPIICLTRGLTSWTTAGLLLIELTFVWMEWKLEDVNRPFLISCHILLEDWPRVLLLIYVTVEAGILTLISVCSHDEITDFIWHCLISTLIDGIFLDSMCFLPLDLVRWIKIKTYKKKCIFFFQKRLALIYWKILRE